MPRNFAAGSGTDRRFFVAYRSDQRYERLLRQVATLPSGAAAAHSAYRFPEGPSFVRFTAARSRYRPFRQLKRPEKRQKQE